MKKRLLVGLIVLCISLLVTSTAAYAEDEVLGSSEEPVTYTSVEDAGKALIAGIKRHEETIIIRHNIKGDDVDRQIFEEATKHNKENPIGGDYTLYIGASYGGINTENDEYTDVEYTFDYVLSLDQEKELDAAVKKCLDELGTEGKSEYRKVKLIYDYICDNVKYDTTDSYSLNYTAYGALIEGKAVCAGYADLFYRLALEAGLDARVICGDGYGGPHAWNIVKIGDVYYNLDSTWDCVHREGYRYFLQCDKDFLHHERYEEYITPEFYAEYPMASEDYGLDSVNLIAPKKAVANLYGHDDVNVSWDKVNGAAGYSVWYTKPSWDYHKYAGSTTGNYIKVANLDDGAAYTFRIEPYTYVDGKKYESRHYKDSQKIYTLKKISTPAISKKGSKVRVKWTNISGETGYQISKSTKKSKTSIVATYKTTTGNYKYISAKKKKTYYYKVRAYKIENGKTIYGPWSNMKPYRRK